VAGTSSLAAGTANDITLNNISNDFGGAVSVSSGNNVALTDINGVALGASTISGNLTVATNGTITQIGALPVSGTTSVSAGAANNITPTNSSNDFGGAVSIGSGNNVAVTNDNAISLGDSTASDLTVTAAGTIAVSGEVNAAGTGNTTLTSTDGNIVANGKLGNASAAIALSAAGSVTQSLAQVISVSGTGTFTLTYNGQTTAGLAFNASPAVVQAALNAPSTIGGVGGSVAVTLAGGSTRSALVDRSRHKRRN
jgi:hypothetical protein